MTKTQREEWDKMIDQVHNALDDEVTINFDNIVAADVLIRKLERELQALKNKKTMAALLMKKA